MAREFQEFKLNPFSEESTDLVDRIHCKCSRSWCFCPEEDWAYYSRKDMFSDFGRHIAVSGHTEFIFLKEIK